MAMDFFGQQDKAHSNTKKLVVYFILSILLIILAVYCLVAGIFLVADQKNPDAVPNFWNGKLLLYVVGGTLSVVGIGTWYKISQLSSGGKHVALMLGGIPLDMETKNANERKLLNIVEEIAIASGVPVPPVYIMHHESGINAFAAGFKPADAVIGVSKGAMEILNRDELQGVIAHEFSHILNGDMRINIRLMGVLHGILVIGLVGYFMIRSAGSSSYGRRRSRSSSNDSGGGQIAFFALGIGLLAIGYIGVFFGNLIKASVSRQREFLADASAVQFTRNPEGIGGALKKIGGFSIGSNLHSPNANQASHLFFGSAFTTSWMSAFATHPPLAERIRRIDPSFSGTYQTVEHAVSTEEVLRIADASIAASRTSPFASSGKPDMVSAAIHAHTVKHGQPGQQNTGSYPSRREIKMEAKSIMKRIGSPGPEHIAYARQLKASIPEPVIRAARSSSGAQAVLYALLLNQEKEPLQLQKEYLKTHVDEAVYQHTMELAVSIAKMPVEAQLPLVNMAIPALRKLSRKSYDKLKDNFKVLVEADNKIDLFEYMLQHIIKRHLAPTYEKSASGSVKYYAIKPLSGSCSDLLSTIAFLGNPESDKEADRAFALAQEKLRTPLRMSSRKQCNLKKLDHALERLADSSPQIRKRIIDACIVCIAADGMATVEEAELLRAVGDALECPIPPFLPGQEI